jgi:S-DNA-T family DNA segregation ATPase FtsK/SpoIIIE
VGFEVVNEEPAIIGLKEIMKQAIKLGRKGRRKYELPVAIGTGTTGEPRVLDLAKMPHVLIAGQTGSGKSVGLNALIMSLLYTRTPEECQLILVDPKRVEMVSYEGMPHLRQPVVMDPEEATAVFHELVNEMERRYELLSEHKVRNILSYNSLEGVERMPYIVTVVDEMADLMMTSGKALEGYIVRLAQLARAVGIHLVLATQKPVVKVITGLIKSNMPSRISFQVASKTDSRVILDENGAEKLAGRGDMLALHSGVSEPERLHGAWVSDAEIASVVAAIKGGE